MSRRAGRLMVALAAAVAWTVLLPIEPAAGCTCWRYGIDPRPGSRLGMLLFLDDRGRWHTGACVLVDPDLLLASADRSPPASRLAENLAVAVALGAAACAAVAGIEVRTRHDPASP